MKICSESTPTGFRPWFCEPLGRGDVSITSMGKANEREHTGRKNLLEFFRDYFGSASEYLEYDDGFRRWTYSYSEAGDAARVFAERLRGAGIGKGDRGLLWSESRPEWIFAFWGSLLARAVVVPIGGEASAELVGKVAEAVRPRVVVLGDDVDLADRIAAPVFRLTAEDWKRPVPDPGVPDTSRDEL